MTPARLLHSSVLAHNSCTWCCCIPSDPQYYSCMISLSNLTSHQPLSRQSTIITGKSVITHLQFSVFWLPFTKLCYENPRMYNGRATEWELRCWATQQCKERKYRSSLTSTATLFNALFNSLAPLFILCWVCYLGGRCMGKIMAVMERMKYNEIFVGY